MENLYEILRINKEASNNEIKKQYRKRVKETHPDRGGNEEEFKKITTAYLILKDANKRSKYDKTGSFKEVDNITADAIGEIIHKFITIINKNDIEYINIIDTIAKDFQDFLANNKKTIKNCDAKIKHLEKFKGRIKKINKRRKEIHNIFDIALDEQIEILNRGKESLSYKGDLCNKALDILINFRDEGINLNSKQFFGTFIPKKIEEAIIECSKRFY